MKSIRSMGEEQRMVQDSPCYNSPACAPQPPPLRRRFLFVITAHVPDRRNYGLLVTALRSVHCFYPRERVLVVDNASPLGDHVDRAVAEASANVTGASFHTIRREPSLGVLSAWAAADEALDDPSLVPERLVFLQHSTRLCRPVPAPRKPGCAASPLAGVVPMDAARSRHFVERFGWVCQLAEAVGIACSPPCQRRGTQCGGRQRCIDWLSASHWAIAYTRAGWRQLASYQLWPPRTGPWTLPPPARTFITDASHRWHNGSAELVATPTDWIVGFERFAGILAAALNAPGYRLHWCAPHGSYMPPPGEEVVEKVAHGQTHGNE
jgi:hypothetical protein